MPLCFFWGEKSTAPALYRSFAPRLILEWFLSLLFGGGLPSPATRRLPEPSGDSWGSRVAAGSLHRYPRASLEAARKLPESRKKLPEAPSGHHFGPDLGLNGAGIRVECKLLSLISIPSFFGFRLIFCLFQSTGSSSGPSELLGQNVM